MLRKVGASWSCCIFHWSSWEDKYLLSTQATTLQIPKPCVLPHCALSRVAQPRKCHELHLHYLPSPSAHKLTAQALWRKNRASSWWSFLDVVKWNEMSLFEGHILYFRPRFGQTFPSKCLKSCIIVFYTILWEMNFLYQMSIVQLLCSRQYAMCWVHRSQ